MRRTTILLTCLALMAMGGVCFADTVYVTTNGVGGGANWGAAASLANGLTVCDPGDQLWLEGGTYAGVTWTVATNNLTLYGGFTNGMSALGERDCTNYPTVLDGEDSRRIMEVAASTATVDGVTFERGRATAVVGGGAIYGSAGSGALTLRNCRVLNGTGTASGLKGIALYALNVDVTIESCTFSNNTKSGTCYNQKGGALYVEGGSLTASNSTFVANSVATPDNGGVLSGGGAGWIVSAPATFVNCDFLDNSAPASYKPTVVRGGALYFDVGAARTATVENCVFAGNECPQGGAIATHSGLLNIRSCTFTANDATANGDKRGGAIHIDGGSVDVENSILWANDASQGKIIYNEGSASFSYCCVDGLDIPFFYRNPSPQSNLMTNNPQFAVDYTDVHLKSTAGRWDPVTGTWTNDAVLSPCIDAGDPASDYANEPAYSGGRVNMGAYGNTTNASKSLTAVAPVVTNRTPSLFYNVATMSGELLSGTPSDITIRYGTNEASLDLSYDFAQRQRTGSVFSVTVGGLLTNVTYWYTSVATNADGTHTAAPKANFNTTVPPSGGANIIHVDVNATGAENGRNWPNAFKSMNAGVAAVAGATNTIWVAQGTYTEGEMILVSNNAAIYGGFTNGMTLLAQRDPSNYAVILDGQGFFRIMEVAASTTTVDGVTFERGYVSTVVGGAAVYASAGSGTLTLRSCRIFNSTGSASGLKGVAFYALNVDVTVEDCVFTNNRPSAVACYDQKGGALYVEGGSLTASNSTFISNAVVHPSNGGVLSGGGAGWIVSTPASFVGCHFQGNSAPGGGYKPTVVRGGALYFDVGAARTATVENCVFEGNDCPHGGAISTHSGTLNIRSCTLVTNDATEAGNKQGGAIYIDGGAVDVENSILWANDASQGKIIYNAGSASFSYCCVDGLDSTFFIGTPSSQSNLMTNNPQFAVDYLDVHLKSQTGRWDAAAGAWTNDAVQSHCIDAGGPASDYTNEPAYNGGRINMGAYGNTDTASKSPTAVAPVVTNRAPVVLYNSATLKGELTAGTPSDITIWYGTNQASLDQSYHFAFCQRTGTVFSLSVGPLVAPAQYWYTCFASNAAGTNWASPYSDFWTSVPPSGGPDIIHVDKNAPSPAETGRDWQNAFKSVNAAAAAAAGTTNTLWVAQATYDNATVVIATNLAIYGGFTNGMTNVVSRNPTDYPVVLDGVDVRRVVDITASGVTLDGLTISRGSVGTDGLGAGIRKASGSGTLSIVNCALLNNEVAEEGGGAGLYASNTAVLIEDCTITNNVNTSDGRGGGVYTYGGSLTASNCTFYRNDAPDGNGGGAYVKSGTARFANCIFRRNLISEQDVAASGCGGAVYVDAGGTTNVTVENCTLVDNYAANHGGALFLSSGTLLVKNSILWTNVAANLGDTIYNAAGDGRVTVAYSCLQGTALPYVEGYSVTFTNTMTDDPLFATNYTDVHLKSVTGRWDSAAGAWTNDAVQSLCIDAGDPASDYTNEPDDNGGRINMGAYGNTANASKSLTAVAPVVTNRTPSVIGNVATMSGELLSGTPSDITIRYGTNEASLDLSYDFAQRQRTGVVFSATVGDLLTNVTYWYTSVATNADGTHTAAPPASVSTTVPPSGGANIIHVDLNAPGAENGRDWPNAFKSVSAGAAAVAGATNTMWVAQGTYAEGKTILVSNNVTIYGGFTNGMTLLSQRDPSNYAVILDGQGFFRIMEVAASTTTVDGVTFERGYVSTVVGGGAIYASAGSGTLTLRSCRIFNGRGFATDLKGIALYALNVDVSVESCTFSNNTKSGTCYCQKGGALYVEGGSLMASDSTFVANTVAIPHSGGVLSGGGAGWIVSAPASFVNCDFLDNSAPGAHYKPTSVRGGALYFDVGAAGTATVENCVFAGNECPQGGAIATHSGTLNIRSCTLVTNDATESGGQRGGAIHSDGGAVDVENSIFWTNNATSGQEIYATGAGSDVTVSYTDLTGTNSPYVDAVSGATLSFGGDILTVDPLFASASDLHLKSRFGRWNPAVAGWTNDEVTSQCIDAGDPDSAYSLEPFENGGCVNLGAYGNTVQASKSPPAGGSVFIIR